MAHHAASTNIVAQVQSTTSPVYVFLNLGIAMVYRRQLGMALQANTFIREGGLQHTLNLQRLIHTFNLPPLIRHQSCRLITSQSHDIQYPPLLLRSLQGRSIPPRRHWLLLLLRRQHALTTSPNAWIRRTVQFSSEKRPMKNAYLVRVREDPYHFAVRIILLTITNSHQKHAVRYITI